MMSSSSPSQAPENKNSAGGSTTTSTSSSVSRVLGTVGVISLLGTFVAYKARNTSLFKAGYFVSWVTAGPAALMIVQETYAPKSRQELEAKIKLAAEARDKRR